MLACLRSCVRECGLVCVCSTCTSSLQERWAVERLILRNNKTYCLDGEMDRKHCIDYYGHRKMVVCPQLVSRVHAEKRNLHRQHLMGRHNNSNTLFWIMH